MNNADYWRGRFSIMADAAQHKADRCVSELEEMYREAEKTVQDQLEVWYSRFATNNGLSLADARKMLTTGQMEEFRWTVDQYIQVGQSANLSPEWLKKLENASARFHVSRLEAMQIQIQQQMELLYGNQLDSIDSLLKDIVSNGYTRTAYEIQKGIGLGWDITALNQRKLETLLSKPWTADMKTFRDRCWEGKAGLVSGVQTTLTQGLLRGDSSQKITDAVKRRFNVSRYQAGRLVHTETTYFNAASAHESYKELGVDKVEIIETLDSHTCELCGPLDGTVIPLSQYEPGVTVPPFHPNCRGTTAPAIDPDILGERAARDQDGKVYYVPSNMKFQDWKETFVQGGAKDALTTATAGAILNNWGFKTISGEHTVEQDAKATNPRYKEGKEYKQNCQRCVSAYEARRRGFDVTAKPRIFDGSDALPFMYSPEGWPAVYKDFELIDCGASRCKTALKNVETRMLGFGDGSRGIVRVAWKGTRSGHVFISENHGGVISFLDPQSGQMDVKWYFDEARPKSVFLVRTDDKEFTDLIGKCCE